MSASLRTDQSSSLTDAVGDKDLTPTAKGAARLSSTKNFSGDSATSAGAGEGPQETYPWHTFKPSIFLSCVNLALQLVLLGGGGSFLFGFCIAGLNTATNIINSSFLQCGGFDSELYTRFEGIPYETCKKYPDCVDGCKAGGLGNLITECEGGGYNKAFGLVTPEQCEKNKMCKDKCGVMKDGKVDMVRCPGGYNDIGENNPDCKKVMKWKNAFLASAILIGATFGSLTGSRLLVHGRRMVLLVTMLVFIFGTVCCTVSNSYSALLWGRLIVGYAVGLVSVASPTYMSEVTPKERRGSYGVVHQLGIVVGIFIPFLLGLALKNPSEQDDLWAPETFQLFWWRFMVAIAILPTLFVLYLLAFVYTFETPVYYVEQRRFKDAASLLALIHGKEDIKEELDNVIDSVRQGEINKEQGLTFSSALKIPEYRHVIIVGVLLSAFQQFGGINVFVTSSNAIFQAAGLSGFMQTTMSMIMGLINIVMTFPTLYLIEKMGRRSLMLIGSIGQTAAVLPAALMYWINPTAFITQICAIIGVLGFVTFFALAYGPVLWVYLFEIYPLEIKDVAAGVATAVNWVAGLIMVFSIQLVTNQIAYTLFAALQLTGTLLIFFLMKETKGLPLGQSPFITKKVAHV